MHGAWSKRSPMIQGKKDLEKCEPYVLTSDQGKGAAHFSPSTESQKRKPELVLEAIIESDMQ